MKRALTISVLTMMCLSACGDKTSVALKGRTGSTDNKATVRGSENADSQALAVKDTVIKKVLIGTNSTQTQTSVLCTDNLVTTLSSAERVHIQGGGQILFRSTTASSGDITAPDDKFFVDSESTSAATATTTTPNKTVTAPKTPVAQKKAAQVYMNLACTGDALDLTKVTLPATVTKLAWSAGQGATGSSLKINSVTDVGQDARMICLSADKFSALQKATSDTNLMDIFLAPGTQVLVQKFATDKAAAAKYVLISCEEGTVTTDTDATTTPTTAAPTTTTANPTTPKTTTVDTSDAVGTGSVDAQTQPEASNAGATEL